MKVSGSATLDASPETVFGAICDPGALLEVIPGCQEIHQVSADEYRGRIAIRLPAVVGTYDTVVRLVRADPPTSGELEGRLEGRVGTISGRATFNLHAEGGGTVVDYSGSGVVSGPLARLDSRFLEGFARSLVNEGLTRLGRRLAAVPVQGAAG
ncbi:MAG TPA: carbon monoxide dehydrogenase subunit G [Candidatus Baltobacteraceae bacterium]|nr:carbon monoxide dehydrogenase subunit G [Candidatus Baltobacteraceae bacterium]